VRLIHIPKNGGTSIYNALGMEEPGHGGIKKYDKNSFAVVRNPYDRLVSHYFYIKTKNSYYFDEHPAMKLLANSTFEDFVYLCLSSKESILKHVRVKEGLYLLPQYSYICDEKDNILVGNILRFENLQRDFNKFWDLKLPHLNKSNRKKDWRVYYNDRTLEIINNVYKKDFKIFNYDTRTKRLG
jgi:hypothetical protein